MSDLGSPGRRIKLLGLVIVGLGSVFFLALGVAEIAGGDLSGFQHLAPAVLFGVLVYLGRLHPLAVGVVLVLIAFGLAAIYAVMGFEESAGMRIAWAMQIALPPLVAGGLLIVAAHREHGGQAGFRKPPSAASQNV